MRSSLIRASRQETGLTPHAFLTDRRVRAAVRQLSAGDAPVDVAMACGFCDQSHLNRAFKARIGVPPGAFRRSPGAGRGTGVRGAWGSAAGGKAGGRTRGARVSFRACRRAALRRPRPRGRPQPR